MIKNMPKKDKKLSKIYNKAFTTTKRSIILSRD